MEPLKWKAARMAIKTVIWDLGGVLVRTEDPAPRQALAARAADRLRLRTPIVPWKPGEAVRAGELPCFPIELKNPSRPGTLDPANAAYVLDTLRSAERAARSAPSRVRILAMFVFRLELANSP